MPVLSQENTMQSTPWKQRLSLLANTRSEYEAHWREIRDYIAPARLRLDQSDHNQGKKKHQSIVDETALRARSTFVAGFVSGMTSPARPWFRLVTPDAELTEIGRVRKFLDEIERRMRLVFSRSNFYQAIARVYDDLGTFGTGAMGVLEDSDTVAWFYPHVVGTYYVAQNNKGLVDVMYRETTKTVQQLVDQFGFDALSPTSKALWQQNKLEEPVKVYQAIERNDERIPEAIDWRGKPYRSVWWEASHNADEYLGKSGFDDFPVAVVRWYATALDDYGVDCPGMTSLGGVKQLQFMQKRKAQAIDKLVNPPMQAPTSLETSQQINLLPGGITYFDEATQGAGLRPLFEVNPRVLELSQDIQDVQRRINETWFVDMFLMISQEDRVRTATEISLRNEEKLLALGPVLSRVQTELLDKVIDRVFNIMMRNDLLPAIPPELEGIDLRVEYISMLAQAQQSVGATSIERLVNVSAQMSQFWPEVLDKVDADAVISDYAEIIGASSRSLRDDEEVEGIRQSRQQQMAQAQALEQAQAAASAAKDIGSVDLSQDTPLSRLTQG